MQKVTNKSTHFNGNLSPFPNFVNGGPPYMATMSLPRFMIGLWVCLFSISLIPNTQTISPQPSFSPQPSSSSQHHQPHVDPLTSLPNISSCLSSSSLGKTFDASN